MERLSVLLLICLLVILSLNLLVTCFLRGSWADFRIRKLSRQATQRNLQLALDVKFVTWWIRTRIGDFFQRSSCKVTQRRQAVGILILAVIISLLVWVVLLLVRALIF